MDIRETIAKALMRAHGLDENDPTQSLEWDPDRKDSQYSMMLEDADTVLSAIMEEEEEDPEPLLGVVSPISTAVTKKGVLFIFMETPPGVPCYVRDVREWLSAVDDAGIPDDTEVDGHLHLDYDVSAGDFQIRASKKDHQ